MTAPQPGGIRVPHLRWAIGGLLLIASILNYVDRQALSILAPTIQADLGISDQQYGNVISFLLVAYTFAFLVSGRVVDAVGTHWGMALFVGWWSVANALTGLAHSAFSLGGFRFLLRLGEAGGYTTSPKVVAEWFPPKDRGVAVGLYSVGGAVGATIAPLIIIGLAGRCGWQGAFVVTGTLGLLFVALWLLVFRQPEHHPWLGSEECALILAGREEEKIPTERPAEAPLWKTLVYSPAVWALMFARLLTDPVWYFYQFGMPKYLHTVRGFDQRQLSSMWMIFVAADIGFLLGGFVSAWLIRRGHEPLSSRRFARRGLRGSLFRFVK